ncbi:MAG TPA: hypothetical protein VEB42_02355 [Chitinophagaceae bacterium]|nr:hypothetical protein [Chitinophagaceae bacterium]
MQHTKSSSDSTHQESRSKQNHVYTDSSATTSGKDSAGKKAWWNYEKTTTTTEEIPFDEQPWIWLKPVKRKITTTTERGSLTTEESSVKTDHTTVTAKKADTSKQADATNVQIKKTEESKSLQKQTKTGLPFILYLAVGSYIAAVILVRNPALWKWFLALFRKKKKQPAD